MDSELRNSIPERARLIRSVLITMLVAGFASGLVTGYFDANQSVTPGWFDIISTLFILFLLLTWYHIDSNAQGYRRHVWLNFLIVGFALIGVPYYLMRSRPEGKRLNAICWLVVFAMLFLSVSVGGEYLAGMLFTG
jgi:hypothetical protein